MEYSIGEGLNFDSFRTERLFESVEDAITRASRTAPTVRDRGEFFIVWVPIVSQWMIVPQRRLILMTEGIERYGGAAVQAAAQSAAQQQNDFNVEANVESEDAAESEREAKSDDAESEPAVEPMNDETEADQFLKCGNFIFVSKNSKT